MNRQTFNHAVIGILDSGEIVTLENVFDDGTGCRGAVGSMFVTYDLSIEENDFDAYKDWLLDAGMTEEDVTDCIVQGYMNDHEFPGQDNSYSEHWDKIKQVCGIGEDTTLSCIGGGRIFVHEMKFVKVFNQELLNLALSYETK